MLPFVMIFCTMFNQSTEANTSREELIIYRSLYLTETMSWLAEFGEIVCLQKRKTTQHISPQKTLSLAALALPRSVSSRFFIMTVARDARERCRRTSKCVDGTHKSAHSGILPSASRSVIIKLCDTSWIAGSAKKKECSKSVHRLHRSVELQFVNKFTHNQRLGRGVVDLRDTPKIRHVCPPRSGQGVY